MIQLAVTGANEQRWQAIARRLRGACLAVGPAAACDAAVCLGPPFDAIEQYLQAGKPMLMAADWSPALLQNLAGRALFVVNPERYLPSRQLIRQQLDAGKLGTPGLMRIHRWEPGEKISPLRDLDLVLWYFGAAPSVVFAASHGRGTQVHLGFPAGGMALIDHAIVPPGDAYHSLSLIGSLGAAYADDHQNMQLAFRGGSPGAVRAEEGAQWSALVQEFVNAIQGGHDVCDNFPNWHDVTKVAQAMETSLQTKQAVVPEGVK